MVREGRNMGMLGLRTIVISSDGITERTQVSETTCKWPSIEKICTNGDYVFVYMSTMSAFIIPKRAFNTSSEFDTFISQAKHYTDMAKQPSVSPVQQ